MRIWKIMLVAACVAAALLTGLPSAQAAKLEGRTVKIGCLVPLTGKGAEWGQAAKPAIDIAVEEINAKGGIGGLPIELICYDDQTLESEALQQIEPPCRSRQGARDRRALLQRRQFETIAPQLDERFKTAINSYCSAKPGLSAMSKWAFRNTLTSDKQLKPVVEAWLDEYKIKKVVIIYDAEDAVSKGEGAACCPSCSRTAQCRSAGHADLPHQGHRLLGAGDQGEVARRRRHRARRLLPERRARSPRRCRSRVSTFRSLAAPAPARRASSRSPARRPKALTCRPRPGSTIRGRRCRPI